MEDILVSRRTLCQKWNCSDETLKRRERANLLHPVHLSSRMVRYHLIEVLALEAQGLAHRTAAVVLPEIVTKPNEPSKVQKERLISREDLAKRLECSIRTLKRYEVEGLLTPMHLNPKDPRAIGYRIGQVTAMEK